MTGRLSSPRPTTSVANGTRMRLAAVLVAVAGTVAAAPSGADETTQRAEAVENDRAPRFRSVERLIRDRMARDQIPSVAVAVGHRGEIVWEEGFGIADLDTGTPATPHTIYRICSVSKVLTATAVMMLVEQGKLHLDRPVNDFLGEAKLTGRVGDVREVTIRRLANHTSGLPQHDQYFFEGEAYRRQSSDEMETIIRRYGNVVWGPGERPLYSNLAVGVLDHLVSLHSGKRFAEFMRDDLFQPLGMTNASVRIGGDVRSAAATPYLQGERISHVTNTTAGAGDMWTSAHDLLRFGMFHLKTRLPDQKAVLTDASIDAMQVPTSQVPGSEYGIGWGTDDHWLGTGYSVVGHHGGNRGWVSFLLLMPSEELAVVVLVNTSGDITDPIAEKIVSVLVPGFAAQRQAVLEKRGQKRAGRTREPARFEPPAGLAGEWQGHIHTFEGKIPMRLAFEASGATFARLGNQSETSLIRPAFRKKFLTADLRATIDTADTRRQTPGILELDVTLRGDLLNGVIYANSLYGHPAWGGYRLNHWVELKKVR